MSPYISNEAFDTLPLHDAVLTDLRFEWEQRSCVAQISAFVDRQQAALPRLLVWHGVTEVQFSRRDPWGPSPCINTARFEAPDRYIVEMQSGDQITIRAESVTFRTAQA